MPWPGLRVVELVTIVYFGGFACAAVLARVPWRARLLTWAHALAVTGTVWWMAQSSAAPAVQIARDWAPGLFLLLGYWLPRGFVRGPHLAFERRLVQWDERLFASRAGAALYRLPRVLQECLELSYLLVYPMVPAGFALLVLGGHRADADRFWTSVLLAEFACYALLPVLPARPPRALDPGAAVPTGRSRIRAAAVWFMDVASNGWNTFPSGHVAGCLTVAFAVMGVQPLGGSLLLALALSITVATVAGRYHFAADAVAGVALAVAVTALAAVLF